MNMGVYEIGGWAITLVFILIDTTAIIVKLFTPKSVYDELLQKNQEKQSKVSSEILDKDYDRYLERINKRKELEHELYKKSLDLQNNTQEKKIEFEEQLQINKLNIYNNLSLK